MDLEQISVFNYSLYTASNGHYHVHKPLPFINSMWPSGLGASKKRDIVG